jgi:hypothetical protein
VKAGKLGGVRAVKPPMTDDDSFHSAKARHRIAKHAAATVIRLTPNQRAMLTELGVASQLSPDHGSPEATQLCSTWRKTATSLEERRLVKLTDLPRTEADGPRGRAKSRAEITDAGRDWLAHPQDEQRALRLLEQPEDLWPSTLELFVDRGGGIVVVHARDKGARPTTLSRVFIPQRKPSK